ncbi:MAG: dTDP-glucose 4,6-dehydratase [Magnetococcales bacterium]|nr:dTDP-glucose 4,6-dehydratase [Magnetococcales bacterium]
MSDLQTYRPRTLLVTGGAGFIGATFVHHLLARDPQVRIVTLDLLTYAGSLGHLDGLPDPARHRFVQGDICDAGLVDRLFREHGCDGVVHFAAESHVDRSISGPADFIRTNYVGTWTLLEAARNHWTDPARGPWRFHHVSTDEVYGTLGPDDPPFRETTPYRPNSPYSASKAGSDHMVRAYFHTYGLPVTLTNCSNNYGPRQNWEKLIPTVIRHGRAGTPIPVYGRGDNIRDWLHVEDHCAAIHRVLTHGQPGRCYNVGGDNEWSNLDLVHALCGILDRLHPRQGPHRTLVTLVTDRPGHDWRYALDAGRIRNELNWHPRIPFAAGLEATVAWYLDRPLP